MGLLAQCKTKSEVKSIYGSNSVHYYGAKGDGRTDDSEAIKLAIKNNKTIYFEMGHTYLLEERIFLDKRGLTIEGNDAIIYMPSTDYSTFIFTITANDITINDLNLRSVMDQEYIDNRLLQSSNVKGIVANAGVYDLKNVTIKNCSFTGLWMGVVTGKVDGVHIDSTNYDSCMTSILIEESININISNTYSNRRDFGDKFYHHFYINNCKNVGISSAEMYGGGRIPGKSKGRAINLNNTNNRSALTSGIKINNVQANSTGGIAIIGTKDAKFSEITLTNTEDEIFFIDGKNGAEVKIDKLTIDNRNITKTPAIFTSMIKKSRPVISISNFVIEGPIDIREGNSKKMTFSDGIFKNCLSNEIPNHYLLNFPQNSNSIIKFERVTFEQNIPHKVKRLGRIGGENKVSFSDCHFKFEQNVPTLFRTQSKGSYDIKNTTKRGIGKMEERMNH